MRVPHRPARPWPLLLVALLALPPVRVPTAAAEPPPPVGGYVWLDVDGRPLPFQDQGAICDALRSARVVSREKIGRGVAGAEKLVLDRDGVRFHAAFRTVDVSVRPVPSGGVKRPTLKYRDAAVFEAAAYELSELLGIGRVPPAVERRIDGTNGTVQIWMEETVPEVELIERNQLKPPDVARFKQQKQIMRVFDILIANRDRNQGNLLIDREWNVWLIDHTRAFWRSSELFNSRLLTGCERRLWEALRAVDEETIRGRLDPFLEGQEVSYLLRRRAKLISHIERLIEKNGEDAVIFDLRPPAPERAEWGD